MRPVWLCPLRLRRTDAERPWPTYPLTSGHDLRQRRLLGQRGGGTRGAARPRATGAIEAKVDELGGHKSLYSEAFYDRDGLRPALRRRQPGAGAGGVRPGRTDDGTLRQGGGGTMTNGARMPIGDAVDRLMRDGMPVRFTAYDGSSAGPPGRGDRAAPAHRARPGAPDDRAGRPRAGPGLRRAGTSTSPASTRATPTTCWCCSRTTRGSGCRRRREALAIARGLGLSHLRPPAPPPQEHLPRWRRAVEGLRHSMTRDAGVIARHYDVSNRFYERVLGPSMAYTCALYETPEATLEEAQAAKFDLVCRKLALRPGQRLLDVGCGWGGMVRPRRARVRRPRARRHAVPRAGAVGQGGDRPRGARRPGRGAPPRLPRRDGDRVRRGELRSG